MKSVIIHILLLLNGYCAISQTKVEPIVSLNPSIMLLDGWIFYVGNVSGGVRLNDQWNVETQLGYSITYHKGFQEKRVGILTNSFSLGYRFFKNFSLSPVLKTEFGYQIYSNAVDKLIGSNLEVHDKVYGTTLGYYKYFGPYASAKLFLSYKVKQFDFLLGGGYRFNRFQYKYYNSDELLTKMINGFEVGFNFTYTIKKRD